jgi:DNA-binding LacI/PurR family transcriptional regulator
LITITGIARELNISPSTVSRAINGKPGVSDTLRRMIQDRAADVGYHPNARAKALVEGRFGVIGVVIPRDSSLIFSNPYYAEMLKGISSVVNKANYHILLSLDGKEPISSLYLRSLVDGLIVVSNRLTETEIGELEDRRIPAVLIYGYRRHADSPLAGVDYRNAEGALQATSYLLGLGHRRIGFISGLPHLKVSRERLEGYHRAFEEYGIPVKEEYILKGNFQKTDGFSLMERLLSLNERPTAVIGINDPVTIGALQAIYANGLKVPDDISVITIGDTDYVAGINPPLTAVALPIAKVGQKAAETLLALLNGTKLRKKNITIGSDLKVRGSTAPPSDR